MEMGYNWVKMMNTLTEISVFMFKPMNFVGQLLRKFDLDIPIPIPIYKMMILLDIYIYAYSWDMYMI